MRFIKGLAFFLVALIAILCIVSLFLPSEKHMERSIVIEAPIGAVYDQVNTLKNWENWSPWFKMDPDMKITYSGPEAGKGAAYSWEGEKTGKGTMKITDSRKDKSVKTHIDFGAQGQATGTWTFEVVPSATKATWAFDTELGMNPIAKFFGIMLERELGPQYEEGLKSLSAAAKKGAAEEARQNIMINRLEKVEGEEK